MVGVIGEGAAFALPALIVGSRSNGESGELDIEDVLLIAKLDPVVVCGEGVTFRRAAFCASSNRLRIIAFSSAADMNPLLDVDIVSDADESARGGEYCEGGTAEATAVGPPVMEPEPAQDARCTRSIAS